MTRLHRLLLPLLILLLAGCSTLSVQTDYDPEYDFTRLKTWTWVKGRKPSDDVRINNDLMRKRIERAISAVLAARGYRYAEKGPADFQVNWFGAIDRKIRYETISHFYGTLGYGPYYGGYWPAYTQTYPVEYEEGTLIIDILDGKTHKLVWRGVGSDYVTEHKNPAELDKGIREAVEKILAGFPPGRAIDQGASEAASQGR